MNTTIGIKTYSQMQNMSPMAEQKTAKSEASINTTDKFESSPKLSKDERNWMEASLEKSSWGYPKSGSDAEIKGLYEELNKSHENHDNNRINELVSTKQFTPGEARRIVSENRKTEEADIKKHLFWTRNPVGSAISTCAMTGLLGLADLVLGTAKLLAPGAMEKQQFMQEFGTDAWFKHSVSEREEMLAKRERGEI